MQIIFSTIWILVILLILKILRSQFSFYLSALSLLITKSTLPAQIIFMVIFFPGVIIHELSHLFTAMVLGIKTGDLQIFPARTDEGLKLGFVKIAKTDPLRNSLIGAAPFLVGLTAVYLLLYFQYPFLFSQNNLDISLISSFTPSLSDALILYLIFAISNTMVLSKSDKQGFIPAGIFLFSIILAIYLFSPALVDLKLLLPLLRRLVLVLGIILTSIAFINSLVILPLAILVNLIEKISGKRVKLINK